MLIAVPPRQRIEALLVEPANEAAVEHCGRCGRAQPEAVDRLQRDAIIGRRLAERHAKFRLGARRERIAARGLTGLRAAQLQHMAAGRLVPEIMIEREDAMDFGARQVERLRHHRNRCLRHVAERLLKGVEDDERRTLLLRMLGDDLGAARLVPRLVNRCHSSFSD